MLTIVLSDIESILLVNRLHDTLVDEPEMVNFCATESIILYCALQTQNT